MFGISGLCGPPAGFFELSQISKDFPVYLFENLHVRGPVWFKPCCSRANCTFKTLRFGSRRKWRGNFQDCGQSKGTIKWEALVQSCHLLTGGEVKEISRPSTAAIDFGRPNANLRTFDLTEGWIIVIKDLPEHRDILIRAVLQESHTYFKPKEISSKFKCLIFLSKT